MLNRNSLSGWDFGAHQSGILQNSFHPNLRVKTVFVRYTATFYFTIKSAPRPLPFWDPIKINLIFVSKHFMQFYNSRWMFSMCSLRFNSLAKFHVAVCAVSNVWIHTVTAASQIVHLKEYPSAGSWTWDHSVMSSTLALS